jgi:aspartate-semialdehyde dehydrogenase
MSKIKVGVLGATGAVGQKFVKLLENHPWFEVTALAASDRSAGKPYAEAVSWKQYSPIPAALKDKRVQPCTPDLDCQVVFSGLDSSIAGEVEENFARAGYAVLTNSKNHRMDRYVPLVIPEINHDHLKIIGKQQKDSNWKGMIVANSNCSTMFLAMALAPLHRTFGVEKVMVVTMQAVSGAGYPGVPSLDILGNIVPFINDEEEKMEIEPQKICGDYVDGEIRYAPFVISAHCNRVAVEDGHTECVSVKLAKQVSLDDVRSVLTLKSLPQELGLPSAPPDALIVCNERDRPQPRFDVNASNGMATLVGRLRPCPILDFKFVALGHNTIRGAAGAAILNAELLKAQGYI